MVMTDAKRAISLNILKESFAMKRIATGAMALLVAASSFTIPAVASAKPWHKERHHERDYREGYREGYRDSRRESWRNDDRRWRDTRWREGDYMPSNYRSHYREVDWREHHYKAPPRGYHYVRDDRGETLLVGIATGAILGVLLSQ